MFGPEGTYAQTSRMFYIVVVPAFLIYGLEFWVMSPRIGKALDVFFHQVIQRLMGWMPNCIRDGMWKCPPLGEAMTEAVLQDI